MKTIKNIDDKPKSFDDDLPESEAVKFPTFRKMFKAAIAMSSSTRADEAIDLFQVGLKLKVEGADVTLEDAEFKLLKQACEKNGPGWIAHYHAQVLMKLKESEKE